MRTGTGRWCEPQTATRDPDPGRAGERRGARGVVLRLDSARPRARRGVRGRAAGPAAGARSRPGASPARPRLAGRGGAAVAPASPSPGRSRGAARGPAGRGCAGFVANLLQIPPVYAPARRLRRSLVVDRDGGRSRAPRPRPRPAFQREASARPADADQFAPHTRHGYEFTYAWDVHAAARLTGSHEAHTAGIHLPLWRTRSRHIDTSDRRACHQVRIRGSSSRRLPTLYFLSRFSGWVLRALHALLCRL